MKKRYYSPTKDYTTHKSPKLYYRFVKATVKVFWKKLSFHVQDGVTIEEPAVFIGNHSRAFSPVACALDFPKPARIWAEAQVMFYRDAPKYVYENFFPPKGKVKVFHRIWSHIASWLLVPALRGNECVPVYRDMRIKKTFQKTMETLINDQKNIIIFPECMEKHSEYINQLNKGFVQIAKIYYDQTGKCLAFYPMYVAPGIREMHVGKPIRYQPEVPMKVQKEQIAVYLRDELDAIARSLPSFEPISFAD